MTDLPRPDLPEDAQEVLWTTYFRNIFNPARLKPQAMRSEMPVKYWRNLPEAAAIPDLIRTAPARARAMADAMPTVPPAFASRVQARKDAMPDLFQTSRDLPLADELSTCTRCPLYANATQAVPGEGPRDSALMIVGEQPGDAEDLAGRPFVGPAGQLFDRIAEEAGLERKEVYVTNAVKHFKYRVRGKRRLHERPNRGEVEQCKWWLTREIETVAPRLIVGMGATAAHALTGKAEGILKRRGQIEHGLHGGPVLLTVHPSYLLRLPDESLRGEAEAAFRDDLIRAVALVQRGGDLLAAE
jgi:DNA polymerase